jgi:hypothetical protein
MVTKQDCLTGRYFRYLQGTYSRSKELKQVRASGKCQTWKTRPDDFKLPVKYGMYESLYITPANAALFITEQEYQDRKGQAQAVGQVLKNPAFTMSVQDTEIHTWFERDRAHVELRNKRTGKTIVEWWDEDVNQAVEDGFLNARDWHGSAYQYAKERGMLGPKRTKARKNPAQLVYSKSRKPVQIGDKVKTGRGELYYLQRIEEPRHSGSTGRVYLSKSKKPRDEFSYRSFFPGVIDAEWIGREDQGEENPAFKHRGKTKVATLQHKSERGEIVTYHDTDIAILRPDGTVTLNSGGWLTATTKKRMNQAFDNWGFTIRVEQTKGEWSIRNYKTQQMVAFFDYITFDPNTMMGAKDKYGSAGGPTMNRNPGTLRATRKPSRRLNKQTHFDTGPKSGKFLYVQEQRGAMWVSLAVVKDSDKGRKQAQHWAQVYHRKHPAHRLRIFV